MKCPHISRRRPSPAPSEKAKAEASKRELERVRNQWPAVLRYAAAIAEHHRRNHFAENINAIFRESQ
jgi:hypothetical protein